MKSYTTWWRTTSENIIVYNSDWPRPIFRRVDVVRTTPSSYYGQCTRTPRFPESLARSGLTAWVSFCPPHPYWCVENAPSSLDPLVNHWIYSREIGTCKYLENSPEWNYHLSAGDRYKKVMYLASYPARSFLKVQVKNFDYFCVSSRR